MKVNRYIVASVVALIVSVPSYGYDKAKVDRYIREAEYYTRQAESFERDAAYYVKQGLKYMRNAEFYSKKGYDSKAKTYMKWAKDASYKVTYKKRKAEDARNKAQLRLKWANNEMKNEN